MPDPNKMKKLDEIGYVVRPACWLCIHGHFASQSGWGYCKIEEHRYFHSRHQKSFSLSIHAVGACRKFKMGPQWDESLGPSGFKRLFEGE